MFPHHPGLRPPSAAPSFGFIGSVKILKDNVPLFMSPDLGLRPVGFVKQGSVHMMLSAISGDQIWLKIDTLGGPRWLVAEADGQVYARASQREGEASGGAGGSGVGLGVMLGVSAAVGVGMYMVNRALRG
jgi:hypothetical protein